MKQNKSAIVATIEANVIQPIYSAVINFRIDLPFLDIAESWFGQLKRKDSFKYCISLLARLRAIVDNPHRLVDYLDPLGALEMDEEAAARSLDMAFQIPKDIRDAFPMGFSEQALVFCKKARTSEGQQKLRDYKKYFDDLYVRLFPMASKFGLYFDESFTIEKKIVVKYGPEVLLEVYEFLVREGCLYGDSDTRSAWLSLFFEGIGSTTRQIKWIKRTSTTDSTNMHQLYITFYELGAKMDKASRKIIEGKFIGVDGEPIILKSRTSKISEAFRLRLQNTINQSNR